MNRFLIGITCCLMVCAMVFVGRTIRGPYVAGEKIVVFEGSDGKMVEFIRTRSALASAEYERQVVLISADKKRTFFNLPIDGGAAGDLLAGQAIGRLGQRMVVLEDDFHTYLFDLQSSQAFSIFRAETDPSLISQVVAYRNGFTGDMLPAGNAAELQRMNERRSIPLNENQNMSLESVCGDSWEFIGKIGGRTGELTINKNRPIDLPARFKTEDR
jgi:hypothetical protein